MTREEFDIIKKLSKFEQTNDDYWRSDQTGKKASHLADLIRILYVEIVTEFENMDARIEELENYICDKFSEDIVLSIGDKVLVDTSKDTPYIDDDDLPAWCGLCGKRMQIVRPGKYQCVNPDCEDCA